MLVLTPLDVDEAAGETLDSAAEATVARLKVALAEAVEARTPTLLAWAALQSLLVLGLAAILLLAVIRGHHHIARRLIAAAEGQVSRVGAGQLEVLRASRLFEFWRTFVSIVALALSVVVIYSAVTFTLRRFPYTRPWGESMREFMLARISGLALDMVHAVPSLFTVLLIFLVARFFIRLMRLFFKAVEQGTVEVPWLHPDTAQPTRRLIATLLWIFAAVMAYPYLPGSGTDAFKGASVFIGLVISLGSSGLVNQMMSSFMITYSRSLRLGEFVRIGEIEGTVNHVGVLSTKVKTIRGEEVTIPNAIVVGTTTTNYSRFADTDGVFTPTSVTIGYDTAWRQVQSLLLMAAERTVGRAQDAGAGRAPGRAPGLLREVHVVCLPRASGTARDRDERAQRQHPRLLQRVRRADHVPQLRSRSRGLEDRAERQMARRTGERGEIALPTPDRQRRQQFLHRRVKLAVLAGQALTDRTRHRNVHGPRVELHRLAVESRDACRWHAHG